MTRRSGTVIGACAGAMLAAFISNDARANLLTLDATGLGSFEAPGFSQFPTNPAQFTAMTGLSPNGVLPFSLQLTIDTSLSSNENQGNAALTGLAFTVGNLTISTDNFAVGLSVSPQLFLFNSNPTACPTFGSLVAPADVLSNSSAGPLRMQFDLATCPGQPLLSNTSLSALATANLNAFSLSGADNIVGPQSTLGWLMIADLTSITQVPEPENFDLFAMALAATGLLAWRRRFALRRTSPSAWRYP